MRVRYDYYNRVEPFHIFLGTLDNKKYCCLNGIQPESVELKLNLNNTYTLSFTVDKYVSYFGKQYESNGYYRLETFSRIYVENIGWFIMSQPTVNNDGISETKEVKAESIDIEFVQCDLINFKINCGTTDSREMLVQDNVDIDEDTGVEFAKEQIKFYNPDNENLSLLNILIKESGMTDWTVGYVDTIAKKYKEYQDGELVETEVLLADEVPYFDVNSRSIYAFMTQDIVKYFECLILFDVNKKKINAYRVENIGEDTNLHIGFRNLQNTNSITVDENSIYTRCRVYGADDLSIRYVNFGLDKIENIDYFLNTKYLPENLINKYKLWKSDVEEKRPDYIELSRKYNEQLEVISELKNRLPLDDCSTNWDSFSKEELEQKKSDYEAEKLGIEKMFTDEDGNVDYEALQASELASEYNQIVNVIIPNIEAAIWNKDITSEDDKKETIEDKDWSHYGLDELYAKMQLYEGQRSALVKSGYNVPWTEESDHAQDYHEARYQEYLDLCNELDPNYEGSCAQAYEQRKQEVADAEALRDQYGEERKSIAQSVYKETWSHTSYHSFANTELALGGVLKFQGDASLDNNGVLSVTDEEIQVSSDGVATSIGTTTTSFTDEEISLLNKLYYDTDYTNDNMFLVSTDTQVTAIDEQLKLYDAAVNDLSATSQPQFKYTTTLDNFLAITKYKDFTKELDIGNYIRLDIRDDYQVKLRVVSITFNPMIFDNNLNIEFSNMVKSKTQRSDMSYLLDSASSMSKNQLSGSSNGSSTNIDDTTIRAILNKIINSSALSNKINSSVGGGSSASMSLSELETKLKKIIDLDTGDGYFNYLQAALISAGKIVADDAEFKKLYAQVAQIDSLLSGSVSAETGQIIQLTADNVHIDEAVIRDIIAAQITVSMLKAGDISSNTFHIVADDGGLEIAGNTMQFKDSNGTVRIQIGRDTNNEFTFVLYDESGSGVLIDSTGIHDSAISDGLIKNDMIANSTITEDKLGFYVAKANEDGSVDIANIKSDGESFEVQYTTFKETTTRQLNELNDMVQSIELVGAQAFTETDGVISPSSITINANCINGATISKWYIDNVENTSYVSSDKLSITIPSSYMSDKKSIIVKVECTDPTKYDVMSIYRLVDGSDAYSVIIESNKGTLFKGDVENVDTICTCSVYKGAEAITANSYTWLYADQDSNTWKTLGTGSTITLPLSSSIIKRRVKCQVDV